MRHRILIFIPTYNCERQLPRVLGKIDKRVQHFISEVLIIDNRSKDRSIKVAIQAVVKLSTKVTIMQNIENYNLGGSIKRAFLYAIKNHYDYMIVLHGDDQADIRDFLTIIENGEESSYDLIIGSRFHKKSILKGYSKIKILGNKALNMLCSILNRRQVDDLIAGLNCFNINFFKNEFFLRFPNDLTFDVHVLLYAFSEKARIKHIPISWREEDQVSNAKAFRQGLIILKLFFTHFLFGKKVLNINRSGRDLNFHYPSELIFQKERSTFSIS